MVIEDILGACTNEQRIAVAELEARGLSIFLHFGTENAIEILADMNRASDMGILYEWLDGRVGIVTA